MIGTERKTNSLIRKQVFQIEKSYPERDKSKDTLETPIFLDESDYYTPCGDNYMYRTVVWLTIKLARSYRFINIFLKN